MITQGDVLDVLQQTPDEHYAACFCDPPYGISFMGRRWDHGVPSSDVWAEVWRVLRPGAILMAFGGTRTWHRLAVNIEDAGFDMFDTIMWLYGSGFPKSTDIGKAIDKEAGAVRDVVGRYARPDGSALRNERETPKFNGKYNNGKPGVNADDSYITAPATDAARTWAGYGSALKPAHEPILCFRKPRKATYAQTAQEWGTGAINVDRCRVGTDEVKSSDSEFNAGFWKPNGGQGKRWNGNGTNHPAGRWPANIILDEASAAALDQQSGERPAGAFPKLANHTKNLCMSGDNYERNRPERIETDTGGASRFFQQCNIDEADGFFYAAKASRRERERGLEGLPERDKANQYGDGLNSATKIRTDEQSQNGVDRGTSRNHHPCVKPLSLCEYLARLIVPPVAYRDDARLLVPFCGSGSEILGALRAGWLHVDGIEMEADYIRIAHARIAAEAKAIFGPLFAGD